MKPNDPLDPWARLTAAARRATDLRDTAAPHGFATRVVAQAFSTERMVGSLMERFALRALGIAGLLALVSVATNYSVLANAEMRSNEEEASSVDEPALMLLGD